MENNNKYTFSGVFEGHKRYVVHCRKRGGPGQNRYLY